MRPLAVSPAATAGPADERGELAGVLFVGDDWAEDHHDVERQDATGDGWRVRACPRGLAGIARLHEVAAAIAELHGDGIAC